jgi:hypothetical protein
VQHSPETETSPRRLPVSSLVAPKRSTGVVNQKLTVSINAHPTTKFGARSKVPNKAIKWPDVGSASPDKIRPLWPPDWKTPPMTQWPDEAVISKRHTDTSRYPAECHEDAQELWFEPPKAGQRLTKRQSQTFPFPGEVGERQHVYIVVKMNETNTTCCSPELSTALTLSDSSSAPPT